MSASYVRTADAVQEWASKHQNDSDATWKAFERLLEDAQVDAKNRLKGQARIVRMAIPVYLVLSAIVVLCSLIMMSVNKYENIYGIALIGVFFTACVLVVASIFLAHVFMDSGLHRENVLTTGRAMREYTDAYARYSEKKTS